MVHNKNEMVPAALTTYGLSSELKVDDKRQVMWEAQRFNRGYDDTEMWCLTSAIARFILPRLKDFKENYSLARADSEVYQAMEKMIAAFELVVADGPDYRFENTNDGKVFAEGWKAFHDYYLALWC